MDYTKWTVNHYDAYQDHRADLNSLKNMLAMQYSHMISPDDQPDRVLPESVLRDPSRLLGTRLSRLYDAVDNFLRHMKDMDGDVADAQRAAMDLLKQQCITMDDSYEKRQELHDEHERLLSSDDLDLQKRILKINEIVKEIRDDEAVFNGQDVSDSCRRDYKHVLWIAGLFEETVNNAEKQVDIYGWKPKPDPVTDAEALNIESELRDLWLKDSEKNYNSIADKLQKQRAGLGLEPYDGTPDTWSSQKTDESEKLKKKLEEKQQELLHYEEVYSAAAGEHDLLETALEQAHENMNAVFASLGMDSETALGELNQLAKDQKLDEKIQDLHSRIRDFNAQTEHTIAELEKAGLKDSDEYKNFMQLNHDQLEQYEREDALYTAYKRFQEADLKETAAGKKVEDIKKQCAQIGTETEQLKDQIGFLQGEGRRGLESLNDIREKQQQASIDSADKERRLQGFTRRLDYDLAQDKKAFKNKYEKQFQSLKDRLTGVKSVFHDSREFKNMSRRINELNLNELAEHDPKKKVDYDAMRTKCEELRQACGDYLDAKGDMNRKTENGKKRYDMAVEVSSYMTYMIDQINELETRQENALKTELGKRLGDPDLSVSDVEKAGKENRSSRQKMDFQSLEAEERKSSPVSSSRSSRSNFLDQQLERPAPERQIERNSLSKH